MRVDARRQSQINRLSLAQFASDLVQQFDLVERVDCDSPDIGIHRFAKLVAHLVVAVEVDLLRREIGCKSKCEFAASDDIDVESFVFNDFQDRGVGECFGRVLDIGLRVEMPKVVDEFAAHATNRRLIEDV